MSESVEYYDGEISTDLIAAPQVIAALGMEQDTEIQCAVCGISSQPEVGIDIHVELMREGERMMFQRFVCCEHKDTPFMTRKAIAALIKERDELDDLSDWYFYDAILPACNTLKEHLSEAEWIQDLFTKIDGIA